jgi:predicted lipid-binding transport protein (Tim44 family)
MKTFVLLLTALFTLGTAVIDAEAKRFGGARSLGKQRQSIGQPQAQPRPPAQQQAAPAAPPAQQPSPASRWLGPLAGLALGAGLAALFLHNGLAGALSGILVLAALVAGIVFLVRTLRARGERASTLQYAGDNAYREPIEPVYRASSPAPHSVAATTGVDVRSTPYPAGFDAAAFIRHAKDNFTRLQAANDARDLDAIRDVLTPALYREIEPEILARDGAPQKTEVVSLDADVLDVSTEDDEYVASVRYTGLIRETEGAGLQPFDETWHLVKPIRGSAGWVVAGIQQSAA